MSNNAPSAAWLLPVCQDLAVAVPLVCAQELLEHPKLIALPSARIDCTGLINWRGQILSCLDLRATLARAPRANMGSYAQVLAFVHKGGEVAYISLSLTSAPYVVHITNNMSYPLPSDLADFAHILPAAVMVENQVVPILDLQQLLLN